jgi:hypothetical protein
MLNMLRALERRWLLFSWIGLILAAFMASLAAIMTDSFIEAASESADAHQIETYKIYANLWRATCGISGIAAVVLAMSILWRRNRLFRFE